MVLDGCYQRLRQPEASNVTAVNVMPPLQLIDECFTCCAEKLEHWLCVHVTVKLRPPAVPSLLRSLNIASLL